MKDVVFDIRPRIIHWVDNNGGTRYYETFIHVFQQKSEKAQGIYAGKDALLTLALCRAKTQSESVYLLMDMVNPLRAQFVTHKAEIERIRYPD